MPSSTRRRTPQLVSLRSPGEKRSDEPEDAGDAGDAAPPPPRSCVSALTFQYFQKVMTIGRKRPLQKADLPPLPTGDLGAEIASQFATQLKRGGTVTRGLIGTFGRPYAMAGLCKLPQDCCVFVSPVLLKALIQLIESDDPDLSTGLLCVLGILLTGLLQTFCLQQYFHRVYRVAYVSMAALTLSVYDKALRITNAARTKNPTGQTVNLISVDVEAITAFCSYGQSERRRSRHPPTPPPEHRAGGQPAAPVMICVALELPAERPRNVESYAGTSLRNTRLPSILASKPLPLPLPSDLLIPFESVRLSLRCESSLPAASASTTQACCDRTEG